MERWHVLPFWIQRWHLWRSAIGMGKTRVGGRSAREYVWSFLHRQKSMHPRCSSQGSVDPTKQKTYDTPHRYPSTLFLQTEALSAARIPTRTCSANIWRYGIGYATSEILCLRAIHEQKLIHLRQEVLLAREWDAQTPPLWACNSEK